MYFKDEDCIYYTSKELDTDEAYAWWFNEGYWDLEKEPDEIRFENGSNIKILSSSRSSKGKQSDYFFGVDLTEDEV